MKIIKLRAWDKKRKMMINWQKLFYEETSPGEYLHRALTDKDYIIMQYTGLKDKNGKEIYEGDIVEVIHRGKRGAKIEVKYLEGFYSPLVTTSDDRISSFYPQTELNGFEVIGNIYEK